MKHLEKTFTGTLFQVFDQEIRQDIKRLKRKKIQYRISFRPQTYSTFSPNIAI